MIISYVEGTIPREGCIVSGNTKRFTLALNDRNPYINTMKRYIPFLLSIILLGIGMFLRYSFLSFTWKLPIYDQTDYIAMANSALTGSWAINCCSRMYVYPFFLAGVMKLFGAGNLDEVRMAQIAFEIFTGLLLSSTA